MNKESKSFLQICLFHRCQQSLMYFLLGHKQALTVEDFMDFSGKSINVAEWEKERKGNRPCRSQVQTSFLTSFCICLAGVKFGSWEDEVIRSSPLLVSMVLTTSSQSEAVSNRMESLQCYIALCKVCGI